MIIATINSKSKNPQVYKFKQESLTIGNGGIADLSIQEEGVLENHLKIQKSEAFFQIYNTANDPFVTLNGLPFGKKSLKNGDLISIGNTEIIFDFSEKEVAKTTPSHLPRVEDLIRETEALSLPRPNDSIDQILRKNLPSNRFDKPSENAQHHHFHIEGYPETLAGSVDRLSKRELHKESQNVLASTPQQNSPLLKRLFIISFCIIAILSAIATGFYLFINEHHVNQKKKTARTVADVAMALTYAQINHHKPTNQNWSEIEFIRENIVPILPQNISPFLTLDVQDKFWETPYILRIYASSDMSQFLVIAQPAPGLIQWLIPKDSIIVDSHSMEIRQISDLKALNRLLVNSNTLGSNHSLEISNLVKQGGILPISNLSEEGENPEFSPPKELAFIRPGAENLIYNAPRYYKFNHAIVHKAEQLTQNPDNTQNIAPLLQDISVVAKLHDMVLYTENGLEGALKVQKGLIPYAPREGFLVGYLSFDSKKEKIENSHLVLVANHFPKTEKKGPATETTLAISESELTTKNPSQNLDSSNQISHQLFQLSSERKEVLQGIAKKWNELLEAHIEKGVADFQDHSQSLFNNMMKLSNDSQNKLENAISQLYFENIETESKISTSQFFKSIETAGLENFIPEKLKSQFKQSSTEINPQDTLELLTQKILKSKDLIDLDQSVEEARLYLNSINFTNQKEMFAYQNKLRLLVLQKLEHLILFTSESLPADTFHEKNRWIILRILKNGRITDTAEREFYLNHFDHLSKKQG